MMKRLLDVFGASALLLVTWPLMLWIWIRVRHHMGAPAFFVQVRAGKNGLPFHMIKFRTMREAVGADGASLRDEERLTPFGAWLRSTSFDELPELLNVVQGTMSLVGPRPLLMEYLPLYSVDQARRHEVLPGITGWAQVNGRNDLTWHEKFALDLWYVENHSLLLDLKILFLTPKRVRSKKGISAADTATMPHFTGNSETRG